MKLCFLQLRLTLNDDRVTTQAAAASGAEVVVAFPLDGEVVTLSEEYFPQFFVGDTVNVAALSKAVNVSHEFLAGYDFENVLGQPVSEIQAAAALEGDQLVTQTVAAREEEVSLFKKVGPLLQDKIQFFVKGDGATRVCHGQPSEPLSSVLELSCGSYAGHYGKCLDVGLSIEALGLFPDGTFRLHSSLNGADLWIFQCSGIVVFVELFGVGQRGTNATNVGSRAVQAAVLPGVLLTLIPKVRLVVCVMVFLVLCHITRVWCMVPWVAVRLLNVPKPLPHLGVAPAVSPELRSWCWHWLCAVWRRSSCTSLLPPCLRSLLISFCPLNLLLVVPHLSL